jgi:hypothetical protein
MGHVMLEDKIRSTEAYAAISGVEEFIVEAVAREKMKRRTIDLCVSGYPGNLSLFEGAEANLPEEFTRIFKWADKRFGDQVRAYTRSMLELMLMQWNRYVEEQEELAIDTLLNMESS